MKCIKCGNELREDSVFCTYCGAKLETVSVVAGPGKKAPQDELEDMFGHIREYVKEQKAGMKKKLEEKEEKINDLEEQLKKQEALIKELQERLNKPQVVAAGPSAANICSGCGNEISEDMVFCNRCGMKVR